MGKIEIRRMKDSDFEQVHKLIEQVNLLHLNQREDIYREEDPLGYEDFMGFLNNSQYICYVAEVDGIVVGEVIATLKEIKEESIFKHRTILFIEDICVDKEYKRQGVGRLLYNKIEQVAQENEVDSVELNVWSFNIDAIRFYEKMGMEPKNIRYEYKIKK